MARLVEDAWSAAVQFEVSRQVAIYGEGTAYTLMLPCETCKQSYEYRIAQRYPPVVVRKKVVNLGWRVGRHLICAHCVKTRPAAHKTTTMLGRPRPEPEVVSVAPVGAKSLQPEQAMQQLVQDLAARKEEPVKLDSLADLSKLLTTAPPEPAEKAAVEKQAPAPAEPAPAAPAEVTKQAHRQTMNLLEEFFDEVAGDFRKDSAGDKYSDSRIALESGAPEEHVVAERERWFGLLRNPAEFGLLQDKLDSLLQDVQNLKTQAAAQAAKILEDAKQKSDLLLKFADEAVQDLIEKVEVLAAEMEETAVKNGWVK